MYVGAFTLLTVLVSICLPSAVYSLATLTTPTINRASSEKLSQTVSQNQKALDETPQFPRTWVPLASSGELNPDRPTPVSFLGQKYVVYKGNNNGANDANAGNNWVVVDDACPHRLAPLSEGRIDTNDESGERLLQCAYHGWSFDDSGKCQDIPQIKEETKERVFQNPKCHVKSYSTVVEKGIVWAWLWKEDSIELTMKDPSITPEVMMKGIATDISTYTRDLPYGWDTLTENLIDPAHVPFAHHGLQGTRDDAVPINMTNPTITKSGLELSFQDRTMKKFRTGEASFRAPYTLVYSGVYQSDGDSRVGLFNLTTINIPTQPGWSRSIVIAGGSHSRDEEGNPIEKSMKSKIFGKIIPVWLIHLLSNTFLDSDLALLHYQEQDREKRGGDNNYSNNTGGEDIYFLPAPADRAINAFRKWKNEYAHVPLPLPPPINNRAILFDRYTQHTSHCRHCSEALESVKKNIVRTKGVLAVGVLLTAATTEYTVLGGVLVVLCIAFLQILNMLEEAFKTGDYKHYENK